MKLLFGFLFLTACQKQTEPIPEVKQKFLSVKLVVSDAEKDLTIEVVKFDFGNNKLDADTFVVPQKEGQFIFEQKTEISYSPGVYRVSYLNDQGRREFFSKYILVR